MKRCAKALLSSACAVLAMQSQAQFTNRVTYTLLQESYLLDECLICGRPDILEPLRGTFNLVRLDDYPPYTAYAVQNINFVAGAGTSLERRLAGQGTYTRFEEFAELQDMDLALTIKDSYTNRSA